MNTSTENKTNNYICDHYLSVRNNNSKEYIDRKWTVKWTILLMWCLSVCEEKQQQGIHQRTIKRTIIFMWCLSVCMESQHQGIHQLQMNNEMKHCICVMSVCLWRTTTAWITSTEHQINNYIYETFCLSVGTTKARNTSTTNEQWNWRFHWCDVCLSI